MHNSLPSRLAVVVSIIGAGVMGYFAHGFITLGDNRAAFLAGCSVLLFAFLAFDLLDY